MPARFNRSHLLPFRLGLVAAAELLSPAAHAQQAHTANAGVYTDAQAARGRALINNSARCATAMRWGAGWAAAVGNVFIAAWGARPLGELSRKIRSTDARKRSGRLRLPRRRSW